MKNKIIYLSIILSCYINQSSFARQCEKLYGLVKNNQSASGEEVYTYITDVGYGAFARGNKDNFLSDNPNIVIPLDKGTDGVKEWKELVKCLKLWVFDHFALLLKIPKQSDYYPGKSGTIDEVSGKLIELNKEATPERIGIQINKLIPIFITSLADLGPIKFQKRSPDEVLAEYKKETHVTFNPKAFFDTYKKVRDDLYRKVRLITPEETYYVLQQATSVLSNVGSSNVEKKRQEKITNFINMLEELIYQSQQHKGWFWSKKPANLLTQDHIALAQEVVNNLYALYPGVETNSLKAKLAPKNNPNIYPLVFFSYTRVLLESLRAYARKAQILRNKK